MTQETEPRIDVKEAIAKARSTLTEVFADRKFDRLLLEEVELSDDENRWIITFGFDEFIPADRRAKPRGITALATFDYEPPAYLRDYKVVTLDALSGEIHSIKDR